MEMVLIKSANEKDGANGVWLSVETDLGKMSAFDKGIVEYLNRHIGQRVKLDIKTVEKEGKTYKNIRGFDDSGWDESNRNYEATKPQEITLKAGKPEYNPTSMYVSYAKDIYICLENNPECKGKLSKDLMQIAIDLVKQARDAF